VIEIPDQSGKTEAEPSLLSLKYRNAENRSIYSPHEELAGMYRIAERNSVSCTILPIGSPDRPLGYAIVPADPNQQRNIVAEAPLDLFDCDDTILQTTADKGACWSQLEDLGLPKQIVLLCDKMARFTFNEKDGEIYQPEIDMRLLSYALEHADDPPAALEQSLITYLDGLLNTSGSATELFDKTPPDPRVLEIFKQLRFEVRSYPDTDEVLHSLHTDEQGLVFANVIPLTYGDTLFQFEKTVKLVKAGLVPMILLTKSKKGPFLKQFFTDNVFKHFNITYQYPEETQGKGIVVTEYRQPIALNDDDPSQVASVNALAQELGIPIEARRFISPDQKRAGIPTPQGERVVELKRDADLRLQTDMVAVQAGTFEHAIETFLLAAYQQWLDELITIHGESTVGQHPARTIAVDFIRDNPGIEKFFLTAGQHRARATRQTKVKESIGQVKEIFIQRAQDIFDRHFPKAEIHT
jgi:hypothetical protein